MDHLSYCEEQTSQFTSRILEACWQDLDSRLYERAQHITDPEKRAQQSKIMQHIRSKENQAAASLASQNQLNFLRYRDNLPLRHHDASAVSAQSPIAGLEDSLAICNAISSVQQAQQHPLWQINKRMALLRGGLISDERDNPLAPASLCLAWQNTVLALTVDARTRLTLYEVFGSAFRMQSASFYQLINEHLTQAGVLPNLLQAITPSAAGNNAHSQPPIDSDLTEKEKRLDTILQDLKTTTQWPEPITLTFASPKILPVDTYTQACREVQSTKWGAAATRLEAPTSTRANLDAFHQRLISRATRRSAGLNRGLLLHAELVTRLFEWLLANAQIAPAVRQLLNSLHTAYMGFAVTDRSLFLRSDHPGRLLLDTICFHGSLWVQGQHPDQIMLPRIRHTLVRLASAPSGNRMLLEQCYVELDSFIQHQLARSDLEERRSIESRRSLQALDSARAEATSVVYRSLQAQSVGGAIAKILHNPCADLLTFTLLRHGYGKQWDQACALMDGIAMSVKGTLCRTHITRFQRGQQRLIKAARDGLPTLGYEGLLAVDLIHAVQKAQDLALHKLATDEQLSDTTAESASQPAPTQALKHLQRGHWYRLNTHNMQHELTLKLAWRSGTHFLFTDVQGNEAEFFDAHQVDQAWQSKQCGPAQLPPEHITEQFLNSIVATGD